MSWIPKSFPFHRTSGAAVAIACLALALGAALSMPNWAYYRVHTFDLGLYARTAFDWSRGVHNAGEVQASIPKSLTRPALATHFDLWLILLAPAVRLAGAQALIWAQLLAPIWGLWGLFKVGTRLSSHRSVGPLLMLCTATSFGLYHAWTFPYHSEVVGWSFLPWWWYALLQPGRKAAWRWVWLALLLIAKEDMGLHMAFVAGAVALLHPASDNPRLRRQAGVDALISLLYALCVLGWWMPAFAGTGSVSNLDHGPLAAVLRALAQSDGAQLRDATEQLGRALFAHHGPHDYGFHWKREWWQALMLSGAWLWWRRPAVFLMLVPLVAAKMWHDNPAVWGTLKHYNVGLGWWMPLGVVLAWGHRAREIATDQEGWRRVRRYALPGGLVLAVWGSAWATHRTLHHSRQWMDPGSVDLCSEPHWQSTMSPQAHAEWRTLVPTDARVSASHHLVPYLIRQPVLKGFPETSACDHVVVYDFPQGDAPYARSEVMREISTLLTSGDWEQLARSPGLYVLRRKGPRP